MYNQNPNPNPTGGGRQPPRGDSNSAKSPVFKYYYPYGPDAGINVTAWPEGNVTLEKRKKNGGKWETTERITLSRGALEALYAKLPVIFALTWRPRK